MVGSPHGQLLNSLSKGDLAYINCDQYRRWHFVLVRGQVVKWYGTKTDLEERKRVEETLRSNEQSVRLIVDTVPGFVCTLSGAGEVQLLNPLGQNIGRH